GWLSGGVGSAGARPPGFDDQGHQRDRDHADDREAEVLLHDRLIAEEVAEQTETPDPKNSAADVEREKSRIAHASHSGDERRERAHDRHEPREHHGLAAVLLIEPLRT